MELNDLLRLSVENKASDLHLSPGLKPLIRINGELTPVPDQAVLSPEELKQIMFGSMVEEQVKLFEKEWELDYAVTVPSLASFRVNAFRMNNGIAGVFRVIPDKTPTIDQLGLPPVFKQLLELPNGLILVTGPTGSGKSTTLAAMVDYINERDASHIITVEDPIEFTHTSKKCLINQRQVHRDTHDFAAALRSALREDPDVILVGEMRDLETIRLALTAAETGHLVMATLHTSSAPRTVNRIVDVFPAGEKNMIRNMLSESLQAVICQTLLKTTQGGRVAALEIMLGSTAIRNLIREDKIAQMYSTIQTSSEMGMVTLDQYLHMLLDKELITKETAFEAAMIKESFSLS
ncbi:MAG TPA: type IV pilus twitching motility protein PilT [Gammaproteobacteria bacterium]|jgi:twitching motility protein PilT|nr:type IV pilus twitching motility protein PilT [Gammaproteobacteria bacterium]